MSLRSCCGWSARRCCHRVPADSVPEEELLTVAAAVEQNSEHPLAAAIVNGAKDRGVKLPVVTDFQSTTGGSVTGRVNERRVLVSKPQFLHAQGIADLGTLEAKAAELQQQGQTVIFVAIDGRAAGIVSVSDPIKESTPAAIEQLHGLGLKIIKLTGDNERTARAVAGKLRIDEVEAGVEPQHKNDRVRRLREQGSVVAMAGDEINDAPAFGLLLSPIIAGAAMSLSSVSVIANALRLRSVRL